GVGMLVDEGVEMRLGEFGIVAFVVAMTTVTYDVDKDVRVELLTVAGSDRGAFDHSFRVVAVDVQHGCVDRSGERGTVVGAAGIVEIGGKTDLVVDHDVHGAPGIIAFEIAHLQHLVYNTLAGNGGVAVDQDGEHLVVVALVHDVGLRTD